jgi:hypothetical protein
MLDVHLENPIAGILKRVFYSETASLSSFGKIAINAKKKIAK